MVEAKTISVICDLQLEVAPQQLVNLPRVDLLIESAAVVCYQQYASKEDDHQFMDNWVLPEPLLYCHLALPHLLQELSHQLFHLSAAKPEAILTTEPRRSQFELGIVEDVIDLLEVLLVVAILTLEDQLQQLEVEDGLVSMWIVLEDLDLPIIIQ
jgi:hypothetical protein